METLDLSAPELFTQATQHGTPIIHGNDVLFVFHGQAQEVFIAGDHTDWEPADRMRRFPDQDLWYLRKRFPSESRIDYKLVVNGKWINDPFNKTLTPSGFGSNSTLVMPGYQNKFPEIGDTIPRGRVLWDLHYYSHYLEKHMRYHLYLPNNLGSAHHPPVHAIYAMDGKEYLDYGIIHQVADYMIARNEMSEAIIVLIDPADRTLEYTLYEPYRNYVIQELLPFIESTYLSKEDPSAIQRTAIGVSWGALTAIFLAISTPGMFNRILSQSGSFWPKNWLIFDLIEREPRQDIRFCLQSGTIGDTEKMNDEMVQLLKWKGYPLEYQKFPEGHSWGNWKGHLYEGLRSLFTQGKWLH
ncbi:MAG TPA: alpha/beta hydrolase-fold protein [Bacillota bacterium]|nr:alpha/beta hydrolase-fold protein [Bacillota bacterium]